MGRAALSPDSNPSLLFFLRPSFAFSRLKNSEAREIRRKKAQKEVRKKAGKKKNRWTDWAVAVLGIQPQSPLLFCAPLSPFRG
jgi:hypothetical protein